MCQLLLNMKSTAFFSLSLSLSLYIYIYIYIQFRLKLVLKVFLICKIIRVLCVQNWRAISQYISNIK